MYDIFDIVVEKYIDESLDESHYESLLLNIFEADNGTNKKTKNDNSKNRKNKFYDNAAKFSADLYADNYTGKVKTDMGINARNAARGAVLMSGISSLVKHHKLKKEGIVQYLKDNKERYNTLKNKVKNKMTISDSDKKFMKEYEDTKSYYKKSIIGTAGKTAASTFAINYGVNELNRMTGKANYNHVYKNNKK